MALQTRPRPTGPSTRGLRKDPETELASPENVCDNFVFRSKNIRPQTDRQTLPVPPGAGKIGVRTKNKSVTVQRQSV